MHTVLVYGDSNTYGADPAQKGRLLYDQRWTSIVAEQLAGDIQMIPEGLSSRIAGDYKPVEKSDTNGQSHFRAIYRSHTPADTLIIALGTNDCWPQYHQTVEEIIANLTWYQDEVAKSTPAFYQPPKVVYLLPPACTDERFDTKLWEQLRAAMREKLPFIDARQVELGPDKIHFSPPGHRTIAAAVTNYLRQSIAPTQSSERNHS